MVRAWLLVMTLLESWLAVPRAGSVMALVAAPHRLAVLAYMLAITTGDGELPPSASPW